MSVGEWKIQFTGVFPLFNATDAALDCKNDLVSSQNAVYTKGSIITRFFKSYQIWRRDFQFCWSGMFIPYPGSEFFHPRSRILDPNFFHPGALIPDPNFFIRGPGSRIRIKEFRYFNPKKWFLSSQKYDPGFPSRIRIPDPDPDFLPIPDPDPVSQIPNPGVKKAPEPGSRIPDPDSQHWKFWLCSGCRGYRWLLTFNGRCCLNNSFNGSAIRSSYVQKRILRICYLNIISLIFTVFKLWCPAHLFPNTPCTWLF